MTPTPIPEEVKQKIADSMFMNGGNTLEEKCMYESAAYFGYSLSSTALSEANKRIGELESQLQKSIDLYNCQNNAILKRDELITNLEGLLALTDSQRKEWADTAIRFKAQAEQLQSDLTAARDRINNLEHPPNNIDY